MSTFKSLMVIALLVASASAKPKGRGVGKECKWCPKGRAFEIAQAADTPEHYEDHAQIGDALDEASQQKDVLGGQEFLSAPQAAAVGEELLDNIMQASEVAADTPQAQEVQAEVVQAKIEDTHDDLEKHLNLAKKHQKHLRKHGATMTPQQVIKHQAALQKHLELALHFAQQHDAAVQQDKAIDQGYSPSEVAEIAPAIIFQGRAIRGGK